METAYSVCPHDCPSTCALKVEKLSASQIGRIHGKPDHPYLKGIVCAKVARYAERVHHPERLQYPMLRNGPKGSGQFKRISWADAYDILAEKFLAIEARYGSEAIWPYQYAGTMGLAQRGAIEILRNAKNYSQQHKSICVGLVEAGWLAGAGAKWGPDTRELQKSELIVIWGCNPVHSQIHLLSNAVAARKNNNAKIVVVDTYLTETAKQADMALILRPGTDAALALAVMHVLFKEGLENPRYLAQYADCPNRLKEHLKNKTPAWAASITGLSEAEIINFARLYGNCKRSYLRFGFGMSRSRNGAANVHAVSCLPVVTGAWAHEGGGAIYSGSAIFNLERKWLDGRDIAPSSRLIDMCQIGMALNGEIKGPPIMGMLVQNSNPAEVAPNSNKVRKGLSREDLFLCVHEQFLTSTALMADLVLPATTFLEHEDVYLASAHTFLQVAKPVIAPFACAKPNREVILELAKRLGAEHPSFALSTWEVIDKALIEAGNPSAERIWENEGIDCAKSFSEAHFLKGFGHKDGKFHFAPDWQALGPQYQVMPTLPDYLDNIEKATPDKPFRLVTAPSRHFLNTTFNNTPTSCAQEGGSPSIMLHPEDCQSLGFKEGDLLRVGNERGEVLLRLQIFSGLKPGVAISESIWANSAHSDGKGINCLTGDDSPPPNGGGAFHDNAVWIRKA